MDRPWSVLLVGVGCRDGISARGHRRGGASVGSVPGPAPGSRQASGPSHRHLAFRGFADAAVLEKHPAGGQALAETTFENCLFEDCERGVAFLQFNDYDYTFDGCEFRRCGVGLDTVHGNFYVRNCHFEASRVVDIRDWSEHCSSIRRTTSRGSQAFVKRISTVASLTIQDCHVDGWKNPEALLSRV